MRKLPVIALLFALASASGCYAQQVGGYTNAAPLTGTERMLSSQGCPSASPCITGTTVDITPAQLAAYFSTSGNLLPAFVPGDCLGNNGTITLWVTCGSGGSSTTFQVNGTGLLTATTVNFANSAATNGLTLTFTNPSAGIVQLGLSGTLAIAGGGTGATSLSAAGISTFTGTLTSGHCVQWNGTTGTQSDAGIACGGSGGSSAWNSLTSGTNTTGAFVMGTGSSLTYQGGSAISGAINANDVNGGTVPASAALTSTNGSNQFGSVSLGNGLAITSAVLAPANINRTVAGTTDTISCTTDSGRGVQYTSSSSTAVTLPQATGSCAYGFGFYVQNSGSGTVTVTPTTSTINGGATLTIGSSRSCEIDTDVSSGNYDVFACNALLAGGGNVSNSGTPVNGQLAQWTGATTIQGVTTLPTAAMPALAGDLTGTAGSLSVTVSKVNGVAASSTTLTAGATITPNCSFQTNFVSPSSNFALAVPTGCTPINGQRLFLQFEGATSYTITPNASIKTGTTTGALPGATTGSSKEDDVELRYDANVDSGVWVIEAYNFSIG